MDIECRFELARVAPERHRLVIGDRKMAEIEANVRTAPGDMALRQPPYRNRGAAAHVDDTLAMIALKKPDQVRGERFNGKVVPQLLANGHVEHGLATVDRPIELREEAAGILPRTVHIEQTCP